MLHSPSLRETEHRFYSQNPHYLPPLWVCFVGLESMLSPEAIPALDETEYPQ